MKLWYVFFLVLFFFHCSVVAVMQCSLSFAASLCNLVVFCAWLCIRMSFYASLCFFAPLRNFMPFVHPFCASLCVIIIRPSPFLCIFVQPHTSYVLLRILVILAHHCASFAFPTILVRRYALLCILMSFRAPSTSLWPPLCILMPFSVSSCLSVSLCTSFDPSDHPCASFGLSLYFLPFYVPYASLLHRYSTSPLDTRPYAPPCILMPLFLCILLLSLSI